MRIGFLVSGELGLHVLQECSKHMEPNIICTDKGSQGIIDFAQNIGCELFQGNPRDGRLAAVISDRQFEILFSINYIFLLEQDVLDKAKYPINFHGSLLPKYKGRSPHIWAIINNEKETGITGHIMDYGCDSGPIVIQKKIQLDENMTGNDVLMQFKMEYPHLVKQVLDQINSDTITFTVQDESMATYFGKRTPADGLINWSWQKERIYNWVRAQAYPYPGAFTIFNNQKLIIDEISSSECGFNYADKNGLVLDVDKGRSVIKTPNGAIVIKKTRSNEIASQVTPGKVLGIWK